MNNKMMRFLDFQFKQGEQITVRRGTEWDIGPQHDPTRIGGAEGSYRGYIRIVDTAALRSVLDVPCHRPQSRSFSLYSDLIIDHHAGWLLGALVDFFQEQYPHWKKHSEIVTLVRFEVLELFEEHRL